MSEQSSINPDLAAQLADAERDAAVKRAQGALFVEGVSGVCDECGEPRPRLVGGRCAYCRDRLSAQSRVA